MDCLSSESSRSDLKAEYPETVPILRKRQVGRFQKSDILSCTLKLPFPVYQRLKITIFCLDYCYMICYLEIALEEVTLF